MNNKFALSFGISLVIVGVLNIFFETSNIILLGLSISTTIFSFINMFVAIKNSKKLELLYIIPFVLLISIFCYSNSLMKIYMVAKIVDGKTTNILTFVSFGFLFISEYLSFGYAKKNYISFQQGLINESLEYSALILTLQNEYMKTITNNNRTIDIESKDFFDKIDKLCNEKIRQARINTDLLSLNKGLYTIQDFNYFYQKYNDTLNINDKIEKYNEKNKKNN